MQRVQWRATKQSWDEIVALGIAWEPGEIGSDSFYLKTQGDLLVRKGDWVEVNNGIVSVYTVACTDCGRNYQDFNLDCTLPDWQWERLVPNSEGGGLLCAQCIVNRADKIGAVAVRMLIDFSTNNQL